MNPRTIRTHRFTRFARSAATFALPVSVAFACSEGCATGGVRFGGGGGEGGEGGEGWGQTSGMSSATSSSSTSSTSSTTSSSSSSSTTSSSSSSSGMGGSGGAFVPPVGTADYPSETEINDITSLANPFDWNTKGFTGSIYPVGDIDVFEVDITVPGTALTVTISDGMGGCPPGLSAAIRVDGPNGLAGADSGSCPQLSPFSSPDLADLPAGKHYVQVESASFNIEPFYVVEITTQAPTCGDGATQGLEQCDDGNMDAGDGCTADCKIEGSFITEVEPNQPAANANSLNGANGIFGAIQPVGDQDFFSFEITVPGSLVTLEVTDGFMGCPVGFDSVLELYSPSGTLLISDDEGGVDSCSRISPVDYAEASNLPVGKYTVMVEDYLNDDAQASYVLKINVVTPGCGDSIRTDPEQCDDGNSMAGDGCSATCFAESPWETESNDTQMTATPPWAGSTKFYGAINPAGEVDYFAFVLPAGKMPILETHNIGSNALCDYDTEITLYDAAGATIETDDDTGTSGCSLIDSANYPSVNNLPAGTYYVMVNEYGSNDVIPSYQLDVTFQ